MVESTYRLQFFGLIPQDWDNASIGELFEVQLGKMRSQKSATGHHFKPYLGNSNVQWGNFRLDSLEEMDFLPHELDKFRVRAGDIFICEGGEVGRTAIWRDVNFECYYQKALHRLRPKTVRIDCDYFVFCMEDACLRNLFPALTSASSIPHLTRETLVKLRIPLPTPLEQCKIAAVLLTWDHSLERTETLLKAKQKQRQALMQLLLTGGVRLQAFTRRNSKKPNPLVRVPAAIRRGIYPPSVQPGLPKLIEKPDGWDTKTMAELLNTKQRRVQLDDDTEYHLVVAKRNRGGIEPRGKLRGEEIRTTTQFKVNAGDFVISRRQIIHGACGIVPATLDGAIVSNEYSVFTVNEHLDPGYLRLLSHSLYFQQTCFHSSVGVAVEKMIFRVEKWLKYPFLLPPIEEQRAITKTLETAEAEIALLQQRVEKLKQQKRGLMQQLLTGKTRVKLAKGAE